MKAMVEGLLAAFSMYSVLPVPGIRWTKGTLRYMLCFFPLIGFLISALLLAWYQVCVRFSIAPLLFAATATLLPVWCSGGVHMDGLADTADAVGSHQERAKKLEILSDPHMGAFGVLAVTGYYLLTAGLWAQVYATPGLVVVAALGCVASRCYNALSITCFPPAKQSGLVYLFGQHAAKTAVLLVCGLFLMVTYLFCLWTSLAWGLAVLAATLAYFAWHRHHCAKHFGGNTGDLAGCLLQRIELLFLLAAAAGGGLS